MNVSINHPSIMWSKDIIAYLTIHLGQEDPSCANRVDFNTIDTPVGCVKKHESSFDVKKIENKRKGKR